MYKILGANGIVFDVVASAQDIPTDEQLIANDILVPFDGNTTLTVTSPIFMEGQEKVKPRGTLLQSANIAKKCCAKLAMTKRR